MSVEDLSGPGRPDGRARPEAKSQMRAAVRSAPIRRTDQVLAQRWHDRQIADERRSDLLFKRHIIEKCLLPDYRRALNADTLNIVTNRKALIMSH